MTTVDRRAQALADSLSPQEVEALMNNLDKLSPTELEELAQVVDVLAQRRRAARCRADLLEFCRAMQPDYKVGRHHRRIASLLMDVASGKQPRLAVNLAPRMGKSTLISIMFPAWYLGNYPGRSIILASHTTDLAVDFGRKVRNLVATDEYRAIFPTVKLTADNKSAGRWETNTGASFYACGVGTALAGRGAHLALVDDPFSEQDVLSGNTAIFEKVYEWFTYGLRTRLMPGGSIALLHTRWHQSDLTGRLVQDMVQNPEADQYEVVEFPAIFNEDTPQEAALWPEQFSLEELKRTRASMPRFQWNAQYLQKPSARGSGAIQKEWFRTWEQSSPPPVEYVIMSLDAAAETHNQADFTAISTWGVFSYNSPQSGRNESHVILLDAVKTRVGFPELRALALRKYREWSPDAFIVEKKSSGTPLYQELRRIGVMAQEYTPHRGTGDKMARLNSVAPIIEEGYVWVPRTRWAEELVEEVCGFPYMANDDLVDTLIMALLRFRNGGFLRLATDEGQEDDFLAPRRAAYY